MEKTGERASWPNGPDRRILDQSAQVLQDQQDLKAPLELILVQQAPLDRSALRDRLARSVRQALPDPWTRWSSRGRRSRTARRSLGPPGESSTGPKVSLDLLAPKDRQGQQVVLRARPGTASNPSRSIPLAGRSICSSASVDTVDP